MGAKYAVTAQKSVTTGYTTAGLITGGTGSRTRIYDVLFGQGGTPADNVVTWLLQRFTAPGTSTSVVPIALNPADPASRATGGQNSTVEPTYTAAAELIELPINQRGSYRWVASPGGELVIPATAANGIGAAVLSPAYTGSALVTFHFEE